VGFFHCVIPWCPNGKSDDQSQELIAVIHDEYNRRKAQGTDTGKTETAMTAQGKGKHTRKKFGQREKGLKKHCTICQRTNHITTECFYKNGKPKCEGCGKTGHTTATYWHNMTAEKSGEIKMVPTENGKQCKVERTHQVCDVQEDKEMEDGTYVTFTHVSPKITDITCDSWLADSATTSHISNKKSNFTDFIPIQKFVKGVGGTQVPAQGQGTVKLKGWVNKTYMIIVLYDVLYVPSAPNNLFSISCLDETGGRASMGDGNVQLYDKNNKLILVGQRLDRMYLLDATVIKSVAEQTQQHSIECPSWMDWHLCFGHVGIAGLK